MSRILLRTRPSHTRWARWWVIAALLIPGIVYLAITICWEARRMYMITGDEPHYLLITESLLRDGDLYVENNYRSETPVSQRIGGPTSSPGWLVHTRNGYSVHGIGLAVLLLPAYALAGPSGARVFLALVAGLAPFLLYRAASRVLESRFHAALLALTLALGLPYVAAGGQIFPDLPAGMLILYAAEWVAGVLLAQEDGRPSGWRAIGLGWALAFLPWLHTRLAAAALVLWAGCGYVLYLRRGPTALWRERPWLAISSVFLLSLLGVAILNYFTMGSLLGFAGGYFLPSRPPFRLYPTALITNLAGAHWDRLRGIFFQQPLLLLGLLGLIPLARRNLALFLFLGTLYLATLAPTLLEATVGGYSFVGRYNWSSVSLWVFPLAYALRPLVRRPRWVWVALCAAAFVPQVWAARKWLLEDGFLYNRLCPLWACPSLYIGQGDIGLLMRLPFFYGRALVPQKHPANYVFCAVGLAVLVSGWLLQRGGRRALIGLWATVLSVGGGVLAWVPPELSAWQFRPSALPAMIGTTERGTRLAQAADGEGFLLYGPYVALPAGEYWVTLTYEATGTAEDCVAYWAIVFEHGDVLLAEGCLPSTAGEVGTLASSFRVERPLEGNPTFEFRVYYRGRGLLRLTGLELVPLHLGR